MTTRPFFFPRCDNGLCDRMGQKQLEIPYEWKCPACPTGHMWQRDNLVEQCTLCKSAFGTFNRRHHCRGCGRTYCSSCACYSLPITGEPAWKDGEKHRVCKSCAPDGKTL